MLRRVRAVGASVFVLMCAGSVAAQDTAWHSAVPVPAAPLAKLEPILKAALLKQLGPEVVIEGRDNWDHQAEIPSLQGLKPIRVRRNHGNWFKGRVIARDLPQQLSVRITDLFSPAENRVVFAVHVAMPANVELEKQIWQNGVKVYSNYVRARFHLSADLLMEAKLDPATHHVAGLERIRATYSCNQFVAENINGWGGDYARLSTGSVERTFKPWQPVTLDQFQATLANALQNAGATRELRVGLRSMLLDSMAARNTFLEAQYAALAVQAAPMQVPVGPVMAPVSAAPALFSSFSLSLEIELNGRAERAASPKAAPAPAPQMERVGLVDHSVHYGRSGPSTSASAHTPAHTETPRKR